MKNVLNIIWHFPFLGFVWASFLYLIGLLLTLTVIASPLGIGYMELAKFLFAPFTRTLVDKSDLSADQNIARKTYSTIIKIIWIPFGCIIALSALICGIVNLCTIIGIPVGIVYLKSLGAWFNPVNKKCVLNEVGEEIQRRKAQKEIEKHLS